MASAASRACRAFITEITRYLTPRRGTAFYDRLEAEGRLKSNPHAFWEFSYDFVDPDVSEFRRHPLGTFSARSRPKPRPHALWLTVPRLEKLGLHDQAATLRRWVHDVSQAETTYLGAPLDTCIDGGHPADAEPALHDIHESLGRRTGEISVSMPPDACAILYEEVGRG
jgi:hypothetical protein